MLADGSFTFGKLFTSERAQCLFRGSALPSVGAFTAKTFAADSFAGTDINDLGIVELFQNSVVSAPFLEMLLRNADLRAQRTHSVGVVDMAFLQMQVCSRELGRRAVGQMHRTGQLLQPVVDISFHAVHKSGGCSVCELDVQAVELSAGLMVCRGMAAVAYGHELLKPVSVPSFPKEHMMCMEYHPILYCVPFADDACVMISLEDSFTQSCGSVAVAVLVAFS